MQLAGTDIDPTPTTWHAELIKAAIRMRGTTLTKLALDSGLDESAVRAALVRRQPEADKVISKFLGVPLHQLWPDRYDESGGRVRHVRDDNTQDRVAAHRLSAGAR
ncbi:MAG: helix-turn-helix domain-containing protein [Caulobacter sp.]|nr:helix-turn-helix domain-containing protein [Caulobacter sp.]